MEKPNYTQDLIYVELENLCSACGVRIEYVDMVGTNYYAKTDGTIIQMGLDTDYEDNTHAALTLAHELSHVLDRYYSLDMASLSKYDFLSGGEREDEEIIADRWGACLYALGYALASKKADMIFNK